jgi:hypothetical protein
MAKGRRAGSTFTLDPDESAASNRRHIGTVIDAWLDTDESEDWARRRQRPAGAAGATG